MQIQQTRLMLPVGFFIFICYIIFLADTADYNFAFKMVGHIPYGDKIAHALLYGTMAFLLNVGLGFRKVGNIFYLSSIIVLTFAILEECTQYYIPSRTFDLWDVVADFVGVFLFSFAIKNRYNNRDKELSHEARVTTK